jgi:transposase InsO family protein
MFWLAAVRGVFSRRVLGWKTSGRCDTDLILAPLEWARSATLTTTRRWRTSGPL